MAARSSKQGFAPPKFFLLKESVQGHGRRDDEAPGAVF